MMFVLLPIETCLHIVLLVYALRHLLYLQRGACPAKHSHWKARLAAIHILREQHNQKSGAPPAGINALCYDPVHVVRAAARDQWVALGGRGPGSQNGSGLCSS